MQDCQEDPARCDCSMLQQAAGICKVLVLIVMLIMLAWPHRTLILITLRTIRHQVLGVLESSGSLISALSITSRNMKLWKRAPGKAMAILQDPEVAAAVGKARETYENGLLVLQEGLGREEIEAARQSDIVDGMCAQWMGYRIHDVRDDNDVSWIVFLIISPILHL